MSEGSTNLINRATRKGNEQFSLIDHVFINLKSKQINSGVILPSFYKYIFFRQQKH